MPFWRRRKPLHEELAEGTGLLDWERGGEPPVLPRTDLDALHGARPRRWDAVVTSAAPELHGDTVHFVALADGSVVVEEAVAPGALDPLVDAVEQELSAPFRAEAVRRGSVWAVAANAIDVLVVPDDVPGDTVELSQRGGARELLVDGQPSFAALASLESYASERHDDYVLRAERIDDSLWEVRATPL